MRRLEENSTIADYTVMYFIKDGKYNSTYRVADKEGKPFFMKFYELDSVPESLKEDGDVMEIVHCRKLNHENLIAYVTDGSIEIEGKSYKYLITDYFTGELMSEIIDRGERFSVETAKAIISGVLEGLLYLENELHLSHNDITPRNIILDKVGEDKVIPRIIDMGHLCKRQFGTTPFLVDDLTLWYCAPETFAGVYDSDSDAFSATAVLYYMLTGKAPWSCEINDGLGYQEKKMKVREARKKDLDTKCLEDAGVPAELIETIKAGLTFSDSDRPGIKDLLTAINGGKPLKAKPKKSEDSSGQHKAEFSEEEDPKTAIHVQIGKKKGKGFEDVAGMEAIKAKLTNSVIWVLRDREKAAKYRLTPPNGMILYGPPGCGKTFFAEKFAEEAGFDYTMVSGSDLGSIYVHGSQDKIAKFFKEAEKHAPVILCFDEFDAFVPSRSSAAAEHRPDEVNEFLVQLNNCAERGIFVIGTTNRLDMIDPAVLRTGRMDLHVEIPAPDEKTRGLIFKIHLRERPIAEDIDYEELAKLTDNYSASDIAFIVNDAALTAAMADELISHTHLVNSIKCTKSSLSPSTTRTKIGY